MYRNLAHYGDIPCPGLTRVCGGLPGFGWQCYGLAQGLDWGKSAPTPYWRAKLDYSNRLLQQFARHGDETVCLALEVIENHAYCWPPKTRPCVVSTPAPVRQANDMAEAFG